MGEPIRIPRWTRSALCLIPLATIGCGKAEDKDIDAKLGTVAARRSEHLHYPVMVFGDFGDDNQPVGVSIEAFGPYVHVTTKSNPKLAVLSPTSATEKVEQTFEKTIEAIKKAEESTPPPTPPLPENNDWRTAPHPKLGTYQIQSRLGPEKHVFDIEAPGRSFDLAKVKPELIRDAQTVVNDGLKAQNEALKSLATPNGFSLCTSELLSIQQGNRGVEPHLMGGQLLLTPIDKLLALKGLEKSIRKLLDSTAKLKPAPTTAHLVVEGPGFTANYPIALDGQGGEAQGIKSALEDLEIKIEELNKK